MNPRLKAKLYKAPKSCLPLVSLVLRELDAADQLEASRQANTRQALTDEEAMQHRAVEMLRLSIVAIRMDGDDAPKPCSLPEVESWPYSWLRCAEEYFANLNSVDPIEVGEAIATAQPWAASGVASPSPAASGDGVLVA